MTNQNVLLISNSSAKALAGHKTVLLTALWPSTIDLNPTAWAPSDIEICVLYINLQTNQLV